MSSITGLTPGFEIFEAPLKQEKEAVRKWRG